ncbi:hypothetical protein PFUGPA_03150 [Plasmodium falciparum Palo Alto/Uganda]|uniref:Uncharacterized protein n=1 Tax=Plasmodium falciparum (isolate Palo Alto / Uganda) TaxID=57270 RepID=W4IYV6_PLAFP|nr:hypothetical protein PFUGPA_03150 [Plasmodium falciparum Palo Alto/Uganda]
MRERLIYVKLNKIYIYIFIYLYLYIIICDNTIVPPNIYFFLFLCRYIMIKYKNGY